jgi:Glycosyltransferase family 87
MLANMGRTSTPLQPVSEVPVGGQNFGRRSLLPPFVAVCAVLFWSIVVIEFFAGDAIAYLAAGERLNAGHQLYVLSPGDRIVFTAPPFYGPLLSPPLIAVVFRPIALIGLPGMWAWTILLGLILTLTVWRIAARPAAAATVVLLGTSLGLLAVLGNVSALFITGYVVLWRFRDRPQVGALVGVMGVTKVIPFVLVGFLLARRDRRALAWCGVGTAVALLVTVLGAGLDNTLAYLDVARNAAPQPSSLAYLTDLRWLSPVLLLAGTLASAFLGEKAAFRLCLITVVFGAPVLNVKELAALVAILATVRGAWLPSGSWKMPRVLARVGPVSPPSPGG